MSLSINPLVTHKDATTAVSINSASLRASFDNLKNKSNSNTTQSNGLSVNLSSRLNTSMTDYMARNIAEISVSKIKADPNIHKLDASNVNSLL